MNFLFWIIILGCSLKASTEAASMGCRFLSIDGQVLESESFVRLREDTNVGKQFLIVPTTYSNSVVVLKSAADGSDDYKYFGLKEINVTTVAVILMSSLEDLVDRDVPRNLLKFQISCATRDEKLNEGSHLVVTVYIEDVNDNAPEFLNTPYIVEVDENTLPGIVIFEGIKAFDRDKPNTPNSEVHFSMSTVPEQLSADGSPFFALKSPHRPHLLLKRELDFDTGIRLFKLPIFAWDRGTPAHQVNTTLTINVRDVDDLPPKFTEGVYRTKINEFSPMTGLPIRVPLYFSPPIMAFDQDSLNASLIYSLISGNERKLFRVNANNGVIYLQKEIDLEEESLPGNTFVLQLEARQSDNPLRTALARIEVEILDLNDNVPEFEADFYNISIVENLPTGFSVLQVNAVDRDQGENAEFLYNLIEESEVVNAFRIDSRSGWITVRNDRLLDREERKSLHLIVEALERNPPFMAEKPLEKHKPSAVRVEITLLDTNDNTPKFEKGNLYEFKVPMLAPAGYKIGQIIAFDPDEGPNGKLLYQLQRPKGSGYIPFRLDTKNGTLYVNGPLRRGRIAVFVEASDQPLNPSERRFSLAVITIEVYATIDEQAIDFVGAPYEFWIGSNVPLGTSVGQVRTNLIYEGEEEIMYDLLHTYAEGVPFAIEERSGIITVIRELAEFARKLYHFEAVANYLFANSTKPIIMSRTAPIAGPVSSSAPPMDQTDEGVLITNVTIHVINKQEQRVPLKPVIEEINMNTIKFHVEENLVGGVIGQLLYKNGINVVNNELGTFRSATEIGNATLASRYRSRSQRENSSKLKRRLARRLINDMNIKLRYIIANQQEVVNKITITEDGTLMTLTGLDREDKPFYDLTVIVEYSTGLMSGAGIYQVHIKVDDVNDNPPVFSRPTFMGLISENSPSGTEISLDQLIQISDADEGRNAEYRVVLQGEFNEDFQIEFVNGTTSLRNESHFSFPSTELFNVFNLTQQWHEDLKFMDMHGQMYNSNKRLNLGPHYRVKYIGKRSLDREKEQFYNLKMIAVDSGGLSGYAELNILVADVNDNAPIFDRISVFKDSKVEIREYTTDMDIYFVENGYGNQMQSVPPSMVIPPYYIPGSPRLNTEAFNISFQERNQRTLPTNTHNYNLPRSRFRTKRAVTSAKLKPPKPKCPLFAVLEDIPLNTKVLQVMASDDDYGKNAQIFYEITNEIIESPKNFLVAGKQNEAKLFAIDKLNGELKINSPLNANIDIFLNLSATDIDGLKDTTCLRFTVIDTNNHAPVFNKSWYSFDIAEGPYKYNMIGKVAAVDLDYGQNANITYSLSESSLPFAIKPLDGALMVTTALDREVRAKYNFQVIATDNAEPLQRLSSEVEVEVNVIDINDNEPEFVDFDEMVKARLYLNDIHDEDLTLPIYKAYLDRSTKPGTFVKQVTAIDKDFIGNGNGLVLYSLSHQIKHSPVLQIDTRDGAITTISDFYGFNNYEHLNVTVVASDLGSPSLSSTAVVLINLQGEAVTKPIEEIMEGLPLSSLPIFQHPYYEVQVYENNEVPMELLRLNLTNGLKGEQFRWTLLIEEGLDPAVDLMPPFEFEGETLTLFGLKSFDREQKSRFQLRLRAEKINREGRQFPKISYPALDERIAGLEHNECRFVVYILDRNDNGPKFSQNSIIAVVPKTATFGYPVTTVQATDADEGLNAEIRYRLLNEPSRLFGIDEVSGKIRIVGSLPIDERVYGFDVKATDRSGADDGRSSIVNVFVYVIDESRQVRIVIAGKPVEVERKIDTLTKTLSQAIQMDVRVRLLEPHLGGIEPATDAYIYAVDFRSNTIMEMEQLQESLAGLQFDALQQQQQFLADPMLPPNQQQFAENMPRIIELAEFGQTHRNIQSPGPYLGGLEIIAIALVSLFGIAAALAAISFMCLRRKRLWSAERQQDFPSSETGLAYTIAHAGVRSCRQHLNRQQQQQDKHLQHHHQQSQSQQQQQSGKSIKTVSSFIPESICSSSQTQSTIAVSQKHQSHPQQHQHHQQQQQHHDLSRQREGPFGKANVKETTGGSHCSFLQQQTEDISSGPFILKYNSCQPVNNIRSSNPYEASAFSLHSNAQDSGVEFLSSRELYESATNNDSFHLMQKCNKAHNHSMDMLCPRHAKEHYENKRAPPNLPTDSSDNYEDSLKNDEPLMVANCRSPASLPICDHHHQQQQQQQRHSNYQNTSFEKRSSCVRHSFSGVKDDLLQSSPHVSIRSRGHTHRNSMNDLEQRIHNLQQSIRQPRHFGKPNVLF